MKPLQESGILKVKQALDLNLVKNVQNALWDEIESKFHINKKDTKTWSKNVLHHDADSGSRRLNGMNPIMQKLKDSGHLKPIEQELQSIINDKAKGESYLPNTKWYSLLSFSGYKKNWNIPHGYWHIDEPITNNEEWPQLLFVFVFLNTVSLEEGPTVAISGSANFAKKQINKIGMVDKDLVKAFNLNCKETDKMISPLKAFEKLQSQSQWLSELAKPEDEKTRIKKFMENSSDEGLKVVPFTGGAGDIIIMDPRTLHSYSANISNYPREVIRLDFQKT